MGGGALTLPTLCTLCEYANAELTRAPESGDNSPAPQTSKVAPTQAHKPCQTANQTTGSDQIV